MSGCEFEGNVRTDEYWQRFINQGCTMKKLIERTLITRRKFVESAAGFAALSIIPGRLTGNIFKSFSNNTTFRGVRIGVIAPFSFRGMPGTAEDILGYLLQLGMTSVELQNTAFELYAGAPAAPPRQMPATGGQMQPATGTGQPQSTAQPSQSQPAQATAPAMAGPRTLTPEQQAIQDKYNADLKAWRLSAPMAKFEELRKKYEDSGIFINLVKFETVTSSMTADEIDYCFAAAKILGAKAITTGFTDDAKAKILGPFADRHKMWVGLHNQNQIDPESFDKMISYGEYLGLNFDIGHHVAGSEIPLIDIIEKYKDRMVSLHLTDRKKTGQSMPFGQGDTPIKQTLLDCSEKKYTFGADIDLEYAVPEGSTSLAEVARCVDFCRIALE